MVETRVGAMRIVTCASPELLGDHGIPKRPEDIRKFPVIAVDIPMPGAGWRFRRQGQSRPIEISVSPRLSVTTTEAAARAAIMGVGVARLLHYQVAEAIEAGTLKVVLQEYEPEAVPIHLVHGARGQIPLKMRRFLDFSAPRLRDRLSRLDTSVRAS